MNIDKFFKELSIQDYLTLGYLYLVVIGTVNIVIYYTTFDINIFDYIAITDILLAPINMLFLDYRKTAFIILSLLLVSYSFKLLFFAINIGLQELASKWKKTWKPFIYQPMIMFLVLFTYVFLNLSINMAEAMNAHVKSKTFRLNRRIVFADDTQKEVYVIATTSVYLFYVEKGDDVVHIAPISGNVKSLRRI
jgi:hypothetical protein